MSNSTSVALITTFYGDDLGGAEKSIGLLFEIFKKKGVKVKIFSTRAYKVSQKNVVQIPYTRYLPTKVLLLGNQVLDIYLKWCLAKVIKNNDQYDFLHVQDFFILPASVKLAKEQKIEIISHVREKIPKKIYKGNYALVLIFIGNLWLALRFRVLIKGLEKCTHIIGISKFIKEGLVDLGISANKISVVYNSVASSMVREIKSSNVSQRKSSKKIILFMPGRIEIEKGHQLLMDTLQRLSNKNYQVRIAGRGPYERMLRKLINKYNLDSTVVILGQLDKDSMNKEYCKCDYVLQLGSVPEAFGRTVLESLLWHKKVIAVDAGAKKELISNDKRGFLIANNTAELELLQILQKVLLMDKQYAVIDKEEVSQVLNEFSIHRMYEKIFKIYKLYGTKEI